MAVSRPKPGRLPESALAIQIDTTQFHLGTRVSHGLPRFFHSFNRTVVELKQFQAFAAFPYAGDNGVLLTAPFGWVVDGTNRKEGVATLYQRGYDLKAAYHAKEWMYVNFWAKDSTASSLGELIKHQEAYLRADFPTAKITYLNSPKRKSSETMIRCFVEQTYPATEYTGFVEFKDFIFFCVLFSPPELANRNVRKLEHVLRTVMPIKVSQNAV
jgi:hypothetical protein